MKLVVLFDERSLGWLLNQPESNSAQTGLDKVPDRFAAKLLKGLKDTSEWGRNVRPATTCLFVELKASGSSTPEACAHQLQMALANMLAKAKSIPPLRHAAFGLESWTRALNSPNKGNLDSLLGRMTAHISHGSMDKLGGFPARVTSLGSVVHSFQFMGEKHASMSRYKQLQTKSWNTDHKVFLLRRVQATTWEVFAHSLLGSTQHELGVLVLGGWDGEDTDSTSSPLSAAGAADSSDEQSSSSHFRSVPAIGLKESPGSPELRQVGTPNAAEPGQKAIDTQTDAGSKSDADNAAWQILYSPTCPGACLPRFDINTGLIYARFSVGNGTLLQGGQVWMPSSQSIDPCVPRKLELACSADCASKVLRLAQTLSQQQFGSAFETLLLDVCTCSTTSSVFFSTTRTIEVDFRLLVHGIKPLLEADGGGTVARALSHWTSQALVLEQKERGQKRPRATTPLSKVVDLSKLSDDSSADESLQVSRKPKPFKSVSEVHGAPKSQKCLHSGPAGEAFALGDIDDKDNASTSDTDDGHSVTFVADDIHIDKSTEACADFCAAVPLIVTDPADQAIESVLHAMQLQNLHASFHCLTDNPGIPPPLENGAIFTSLNRCCSDIIGEWLQSLEGEAEVGDASKLFATLHGGMDRAHAGTPKHRHNIQWPAVLSAADDALLVRIPSEGSHTKGVTCKLLVAGVGRLPPFCSVLVDFFADFTKEVPTRVAIPPVRMLYALERLADSISMAWLAAAACCASLARLVALQNLPRTTDKYPATQSLFELLQSLPTYVLLIVLRRLAAVAMDFAPARELLSQNDLLVALQAMPAHTAAEKHELWKLFAPKQVLERAFCELEQGLQSFGVHECRELADTVQSEMRARRIPNLIASTIWTSAHSAQACWFFASQHAQSSLVQLLNTAKELLLNDTSQTGRDACSLISEQALTATVDIALGRLDHRSVFPVQEAAMGEAAPESAETPRSMCFCSPEVTAALNMTERAILDVLQDVLIAGGMACSCNKGVPALAMPEASVREHRKVADACTKLLADTGSTLRMLHVDQPRSQVAPNAATGHETIANTHTLVQCAACKLHTCCWGFEVKEGPKPYDASPQDKITHFSESMMQIRLDSARPDCHPAACAGGAGLDDAQSSVQQLTISSAYRLGRENLDVGDLRQWAQPRTATLLNASMCLVTTLQRARTLLERQASSVAAQATAQRRAQWPIITCAELLGQSREAREGNIVFKQAYSSQLLGSMGPVNMSSIQGVLFVVTSAHCLSVLKREAASTHLGHAWCICVRPKQSTASGTPAVLLEVYDSLPDLGSRPVIFGPDDVQTAECLLRVPDIVMRVIVTELAPVWFGSTSYQLVNYCAVPQDTLSSEAHSEVTGADSARIKMLNLAAAQTGNTLLANSCVWMSFWHAQLLQEAAAVCLPPWKTASASAAQDSFVCKTGRCETNNWRLGTIGAMRALVVADITYGEVKMMKRLAILLVSCMSRQIPRAVPVKPLWAKMFYSTIGVLLSEFQEVSR